MKKKERKSKKEREKEGTRIKEKEGMRKRKMNLTLEYWYRISMGQIAAISHASKTIATKNGGISGMRKKGNREKEGKERERKKVKGRRKEK